MAGAHESTELWRHPKYFFLCVAVLFLFMCPLDGWIKSWCAIKPILKRSTFIHFAVDGVGFEQCDQMLEPKVAVPLILKKFIVIIQICPLKARKSKLLSVFDSCDELAKKYSRLDCFFAVRKCTFKLWWNCSGVSSAESDNQSLKLRSLPWRSFPEIITSVHKVKKTKKRNRQLSQKLDKKRWQIKLNRIKFCLCSKIYFLDKELLLLWLFSARKHFENHARHETVFELFYFGIMTS